MSSKLVHIKSIPRSTATGVSEWVSDTSGKRLNKTKIGRAKDRLQALYSAKIGGLANYISYNYHNDPITGEPIPNEKGQPMLLQEYLEKKWNKPAGYFSNQPVSRNYRGDGSDLSYFYQKSWSLGDGTTILDMANMDDEIGYYVLLASSKVANSEAEWKSHKWPKAQWYIALENESAEIRYSKNQQRVKAFASLDSSEMNDRLRRVIASLLGLTDSRNDLSSESSYNILTDFIESSSTGAQGNIIKFMNLVQLLKTKDGKEKLEAMWTLKQAQDLRIVYEKQDVWNWIKTSGQTMVIGDRYSEAIEYLLSPKKAAELDDLLAQIKARQRDTQV